MLLKNMKPTRADPEKRQPIRQSHETPITRNQQIPTNSTNTTVTKKQYVCGLLLMPISQTKTWPSTTTNQTNAQASTIPTRVSTIIPLMSLARNPKNQQQQQDSPPRRRVAKMRAYWKPLLQTIMQAAKRRLMIPQYLQMASSQHLSMTAKRPTPPRMTIMVRLRQNISSEQRRTGMEYFSQAQCLRQRKATSARMRKETRKQRRVWVLSRMTGSCSWWMACTDWWAVLIKKWSMLSMNYTNKIQLSRRCRAVGGSGQVNWSTIVQLFLHIWYCQCLAQSVQVPILIDYRSKGIGRDGLLLGWNRSWS